MPLSTTVRYRARAITQVAGVNSGRPVTVREIAEQQTISPKYLEHILKALKAGGLVRAVRGKQGGYVLAKSPGCQRGQVHFLPGPGQIGQEHPPTPSVAALPFSELRLLP